MFGTREFPSQQVERWTKIQERHRYKVRKEQKPQGLRKTWRKLVVS